MSPCHLVTLSSLLLLAGAAGYWWWYGAGVVPPPEVDTSGREPEIAAAVEAARAEVRKQPRSGTAWGEFGLVLLAHDYEAPARVCLARAEQLDPQDPRWAYLNGRLAELRDPEAALPLLRRAADLPHAKSVIRLHLAETLLGQGHTEEAAAEFHRALEENPDSPRGRLGLGRIAYQQGDLDTALDRVRQAAADVPTLRAAHALLAEIYHRRGDTAAEERELALLPQCQDLDWPDSYFKEIDSKRVGSPARIARAEGLLEEGRLREAVAELEAAVRAGPGSFRARLLLGHNLDRLGDPAGGEAQLREALRLQPDSFEAQGDLGLVLQHEAKYAEAAECYRRVLARQPEHALAHFNLAHCQERLGDRDGAVASLRAALRCKPEFAWAHRVLGRLLHESGQDAEAAEHLRTALRLAPDDAEAKSLLEQVQAGRARPGKEKDR